MISCRHWTPRAGTLRRFLLCWLLGGVWGIVAVVTLWHLGLNAGHQARLQEARLRDALRAAPAPPPAPMLFRVSAMTGERLAGDAGFAPFPWRDERPTVASPSLYVSSVRGSLVRAGAAIVPGDAGDVFVQVALPWRDRLPSWREVLLDSPLGMVYACALLVSAVIVSGVHLGLRWLDHARTALNDPDAGDYAGPDELLPAVERMRVLHQRQTRWVDEQRRFLADASHQLRTPMAVLRTQLQSAIAGDVAADEVLPQMLHTVDRATGLANQLLSLTKVEQLKRSGDLAAVDLHDAARDAVMELSPLIAAKRLDFALEGRAPVVQGDAVMLGELLRNLLANAIHHTPHAGRLGVLLRDGAGRTEVVVWDEGPGVDEDVRQRLFQPFSAGKGGTGLGLSICRQIAGAMGATVDLYNRIDARGVIGVDAVVAWGQGP